VKQDSDTFLVKFQVEITHI